MFPLSFPYRALRHASPSDLVLDPFCGRGTTNFAARFRGLSSVGIDTNPVAIAITRAKFVEVEPKAIVSLAAEALEAIDAPDIPHGEFWKYCFSPSTLRDVCKIREYLLSQRSDRVVAVALRALMLGILHGPRNKGEPTYLSNQMPRTYATKPAAAVRFWKRERLKAFRVPLLDAVRRRALFTFKSTPNKVSGYVVQGDARHTNLARHGERFSYVITSPPYLGMDTYVADQWLRNWFIGGPAHVHYGRGEQLNSVSVSWFVCQLAEVWSNVAKVCNDGARLIIRFGALPYLRVDPRVVLTASIKAAGCGWRVRHVANAGRATIGRRQAEQFLSSARAPVPEIDLIAVLEG